MRYRNSKTGVIVNTPSRLGGLWVPLDAVKPVKAEPAPAEPVEEAEPVVEVKKAPARKRTTKKTKK